MEKLVIVLVSLLCCYSAGAQKRRAIVVDHSLIAVFKEPPSGTFEGRCSQATLSEEDFVLAESLLTTFFDDYNAVKSKEFQKEQARHPEWKPEKSSYVINWKNYRKQYFPVVNDKGEKELWINCFCGMDDDDRWKKYLIRVHDGGNCFFNIKINLTLKKVYDLRVNGVA